MFVPFKIEFRYYWDNKSVILIRINLVSNMYVGKYFKNFVILIENVFHMSP